MIKKLSNKSLLLILVALLVVFGLSRYISNRKGENTFHTAIIPRLDSAKMNGMVIFASPRMVKTDTKDKSLPFIFTRKDKQWYISKGDFRSMADPKAANYMITQLEQISPDRLASIDPKDWKQYDVTDSLGTRVVLLYDKDTALDVIVGRFSFLPKEKKSMTYLRLSGQKEVYIVNGYLAMNINGGFDSWRNKRIAPSDYNKWTKLTFTYPGDSSFVVKKDSGKQWVFGDGTKPDSLVAASIANDISNQNYGDFLAKFDTNGKQALFTLRLEGSSLGNVLIKAYPGDSANKYVISSTVNPGSFISGNNGIFSKVFPGKAAFLKKN